MRVGGITPGRGGGGGGGSGLNSSSAQLRFGIGGGEESEERRVRSGQSCWTRGWRVDDRDRWGVLGGYKAGSVGT